MLGVRQYPYRLEYPPISGRCWESASCISIGGVNNANSASTPNNSSRKRILALIALATLVTCGFVLAAGLGWLVLPWIVSAYVVGPRAHELARLAGGDNDLAKAITLVTVVIAVFLTRLVFGRGWRRGWSAIALFAALALTYFGLHSWLAHGHLYGTDGKPLFYWGLTPEGEIYKQSEPGLNPYTGKPLAPASREYLTLIHSLLHEPLHEVDPVASDWFDSNTGWPLLWWCKCPDGRLAFYSRPGIHPFYCVELEEVTLELRREWEQSVARQRAERRVQENLQREKKQEEEAAAKSLVLREQARLDELARQREQAEKEKATRARRAVILARRASEASAPVSELAWFEPPRFFNRVCPLHTAESFQVDVFDDEFAGRRLRYHGCIAKLDSDRYAAWLEPLSAGKIHLAVCATFHPDAFRSLRLKDEVTLAGTVASIRFDASETTISGLVGRICEVVFGNAVVVNATDAAQQPSSAVALTPTPQQPWSTPMMPAQRAAGTAGYWAYGANSYKKVPVPRLSPGRLSPNLWFRASLGIHTVFDADYIPFQSEFCSSCPKRRQL